MRIFRILKYVILLVTITGCNSNRAEITCKDSAGSIPEEIYARRFSMTRMEDHTEIRIKNPWQGAKNVDLRYILVRRGEKSPEGVDTSQVIYVPVRRMISMSTTYFSMFKELGVENSIVGISGTALIFNDYLREKAGNGEISDVGFEDNLNKELIIKLAPDLLMVYGIEGEASGYLNKLKDLGIKIFFNADYLEEYPLAKAEWIKVFGALYGKEKEADDIFRKIENEYTTLAHTVKENVKYRPEVLLGLPWKDTWYVSPGNSYISSLINDAGGEYIYKNTRSETSMPFGIENVWMRASEADFWLNIGNVETREEILNTDSRLKDLRSFRNGNLYNNNKRTTPEGGNDYWESGSVSPHVILRDISAILHPELFPDYNLYYYKKVR